MSTFKISVDLSGLLSSIAGMRQSVLTRTHEAVGLIAQQAYMDWAGAIKEASMYDKYRTDYMASLKWEWRGDFAATVFSDYQFANNIEYGWPERDLKKMLDTSMKVRVNGKGKRYMIIPFRHNNPESKSGSAMPFHVYAEARNLAASSVIGSTFRLSGTGAYHMKTRTPIKVNKSVYKWGDSLPAGLTEKLKPHHKTDIHAGMYRFKASSGNESRSSYITFRVMSEDSKGWIVKAKPGLNLAQGVTDRLQPLAEQILAEAVTQDLNNG